MVNYSNKYGRNLTNADRLRAMSTLEEGSEEWNFLDNYGTDVGYQNRADYVDDINGRYKTPTSMARKMDDMFGGGHVDLANRPLVSGADMQKAGWDTGDDGYSTVYTSAYSSEDGKRTVALTPIMADGSVLSPTELSQYADELLNGGIDRRKLLLRNFYGKDSIAESNNYAENLHRIQAQYYGLD